MSPQPRSPQPPHPDGTVRHRLSVDKLSGPQLDRFLEAIRQSAAKADDTGFQWFAGRHGVPGNYCQHHISGEHGKRFFLPWHRAYLYFFELSLQALVPDVTLPWWDWTYEPPAGPSGIPAAYSRARLSDGSA